MVEQKDSIAYRIIAVIAVFLPIAIISVLLRLHVRRNIMRALGVDDALMVFALVSYETSKDRPEYRDNKSSVGYHGFRSFIINRHLPWIRTACQVPHSSTSS